MIYISEYVNLKNLHTFKLEVKSRYVVKCTSVNDLLAFIDRPLYKSYPSMILGEGSNILFTKDYPGMLIRPLIKGISFVAEDDKHVYLSAGSGENWDTFVEYTVNANYGGLENLSLIPGSVGACPVQNIGAYGVEVGNYIEYIEYIDIEKKQRQTIQGSDCRFDYRDSIFKHDLKNKAVITRVVFRLDKQPLLQTTYGELRKQLSGYPKANIATVRYIVSNIRRNKLPDPAVTGNAGSFFKNPLVPNQKAEKLKEAYPDMPLYDVSPHIKKIAAAWLIDHCGWKGKRHDGAAVHDKQPLVIVNTGNATVSSIMTLAAKIQESVVQTFGIMLEHEVQIV